MPINRCNAAGFRILLGLALTVATLAMLSPAPQDGVLPFAHADKLAHLGTFLTLGFLADAGWPESDFAIAKWLPLLIYGIGIECLQLWMPGRSFSLLDMLADGTGLVIYGLLILPLLRRYRIR